MEIRSIRLQLAELMRSQAMNTTLILAGLIHLQPGDPMLTRLFEVQDELYQEMRCLIGQLTLPEEGLLEEFDRRLYAHRLQVMLVSQNIHVLSGDAGSLD